VSLQDLANSNNFPATLAIFFKSDTAMIAIGCNIDVNTASYRLITQADLSACVKKNHIYVCEDQHTLCKDLAGSYLSALYLQNEVRVHHHCRIDICPFQKTTYQISATATLFALPFYSQLKSKTKMAPTSHKNFMIFLLSAPTLLHLTHHHLCRQLLHLPNPSYLSMEFCPNPLSRPPP
jgi:hypothetical protein